MQVTVMVIRNSDNTVVKFFDAHHTKAMGLAMTEAERWGVGYHVTITLDRAIPA